MPNSSNMKQVWSAFLLFVLVNILEVTSESCRQKLPPEEANFYYFSSKTPYELIHGGGEIPEPIEYPGCTANKIWILSRHGTRYPDKDHIKELQETIPTLKEKILNISAQGGSGVCAEDIQLLKESSFNITKKDSNRLTDQGYLDLYKLAKRFQMRFPGLLKTEYSPENFTFWTTDTQRTEESMKSFAKGLFGNDSQIQTDPPGSHDKLIRTYDFCELRVDLLNNKPEEYKSFKKGTEYKNVISTVSKRLGFTLKADDIDAMYDMCRYEKAWTPDKPSAWCLAFDNQELKVLEYKQDLKYYYNSGYGRLFNKDIGCSLVANLYEYLENGSSIGNFYFSHSDMLQLTLTALSIGQDAIPLKYDNMALHDERQWRTSKLASFATNIAAVVYSCPSDPIANQKVQLWVSEHPVLYPGCDKSTGLCPWSVFKNIYEERVNQCDLSTCLASTPFNQTNPIIVE